MIRIVSIALFALTHVPAWSQNPPTPAPPAAVAAPVAAPVAPAAPDFGGFVATEVQELDPVYDSNVDELRNHPLYARATTALQAARQTDVMASTFVGAMRKDFDTLRQSGIFNDAVGLRALAELEATIKLHVDALARLSPTPGEPEMPLAAAVRTYEFPSEDFKTVSYIPAGSKVASGKAGWRITVVLFAGDRHRLPLFAFFTPDPQADTEARFAEYLTPDQFICISAFCDAAWRVRDNVVPIAKIASELELNDRAWDNYLERGFPQFPWENLVNDWAVSSAWDQPPDWQLVVLHPTPGFVFDIDSAKHAELDAALLVHVLGYVAYPSEDRGWYLGGSATLGVTTDDDRGLAYGLTLHAGITKENSPIPQIDIGVLRYEGENDDGWLLSIGFDLGHLLSPSASR